MRNSGAAIALLSTGLLVLAVVTPAAAAVGDASSPAPVGVTWSPRTGVSVPLPGIPGTPIWAAGIAGTSTFAVTDGRPGFNGPPYKKAATDGDHGSYTLTRTDGAFLTIGVVPCVRVDASGWAEFAGVVSAASLPYVVGEVFLVSVLDGGPGFALDGIGMKSHGVVTADPYDPDALSLGCSAALDGKQFKRQGVITAGDITVN